MRKGQVNPASYFSIHEFMGVDAPADLAKFRGERVLVRNRVGLCETKEVLRWAENDATLVYVGGAGMGCDRLRDVAESLRPISGEEWRKYRESGSARGS